ncbi:hypothetical protein COO60DRAFT_1535275 [Scenedesmus sp. NREL 46B-D3]|nr:hypothetical protein COO60DRAFT_1535275 [Scenedesmus sp. NREL 46B-D3]
MLHVSLVLTALQLAITCAMHSFVKSSFLQDVVLMVLVLLTGLQLRLFSFCRDLACCMSCSVVVGVTGRDCLLSVSAASAQARRSNKYAKAQVLQADCRWPVLC